MECALEKSPRLKNNYVSQALPLIQQLSVAIVMYQDTIVIVLLKKSFRFLCDKELRTI